MPLIESLRSRSAKYQNPFNHWVVDNPLTEKAITMAIGIISIILLSCSINIFFTAGSSNQAIAAVPPATAKDSINAITNL